MKAVELIQNQERLLLEDAIESKKMKSLANTLNSLLMEMNKEMASIESFLNNQISGELNSKIIIAKSLAEFFAGNKVLKIEQAVENLRNQEKANINKYYATKTKLLETIRNIMKDSSKEAVVSNFDIFNGDFQRCEAGHEIIILGDRNLVVLDTLLKELDAALIVNGNFDTITSQTVDYNLDTLNRNIELCNRKNNEVYGSKQGKLAKFEQIINKLNEIGEKVIAFYTYKEASTDIGCDAKSIKSYENELEKLYIPLKKTLQKEFKIELEDICEVVANEEQYSEVDSVEELTQTTEFGGIADNLEPVNIPSYESQEEFETTESYEPTETPANFSNPFETITEQPTSNNYFENNTTSVSPFETVEPTVNPFEVADNSTASPNPWEDQTTSPFSSFEQESPVFPTTEATANNPFDFDNTQRQNPFNSNNNPFDN